MKRKIKKIISIVLVVAIFSNMVPFDVYAKLERVEKENKSSFLIDKSSEKLGIEGKVLAFGKIYVHVGEKGKIRAFYLNEKAKTNSEYIKYFFSEGESIEIDGKKIDLKNAKLDLKYSENENKIKVIRTIQDIEYISEISSDLDLIMSGRSVFKIAKKFKTNSKTEKTIKFRRIQDIDFESNKKTHFQVNGIGKISKEFKTEEVSNLNSWYIMKNSKDPLILNSSHEEGKEKLSRMKFGNLESLYNNKKITGAIIEEKAVCYDYEKFKISNGKSFISSLSFEINESKTELETDDIVVNKTFSKNIFPNNEENNYINKDSVLGLYIKNKNSKTLKDIETRINTGEYYHYSIEKRSKNILGDLEEGDISRNEYDISMKKRKEDTILEIPVSIYEAGEKLSSFNHKIRKMGLKNIETGRIEDYIEISVDISASKILTEKSKNKFVLKVKNKSDEDFENFELYYDMFIHENENMKLKYLGKNENSDKIIKIPKIKANESQEFIFEIIVEDIIIPRYENIKFKLKKLNSDFKKSFSHNVVLYKKTGTFKAIGEFYNFYYKGERKKNRLKIKNSGEADFKDISVSSADDEIEYFLKGSGILKINEETNLIYLIKDNIKKKNKKSQFFFKSSNVEGRARVYHKEVKSKPGELNLIFRNTLDSAIEKIEIVDIKNNTVVKRIDYKKLNEASEKEKFRKLSNFESKELYAKLDYNSTKDKIKIKRLIAGKYNLNIIAKENKNIQKKFLVKENTIKYLEFNNLSFEKEYDIDMEEIYSRKISGDRFEIIEYQNKGIGLSIKDGKEKMNLFDSNKTRLEFSVNGEYSEFVPFKNKESEDENSLKSIDIREKIDIERDIQIIKVKQKEKVLIKYKIKNKSNESINFKPNFIMPYKKIDKKGLEILFKDKNLNYRYKKTGDQRIEKDEIPEFLVQSYGEDIAFITEFPKLEAEKPELIRFSKYEKLSNIDYKKKFESEGLSANFEYKTRTLKSKESYEIGLYYGLLDEKTKKEYYNLTCNFPKKNTLKANKNKDRYINNPFDFNFTLKNLSQKSIKNAVLQIILPEDIKLDSGNDKKENLNFALNEEKTMSFKLKVNEWAEKNNYNIKVRIKLEDFTRDYLVPIVFEELEKDKQIFDNDYSIKMLSSKTLLKDNDDIRIYIKLENLGKNIIRKINLNYSLISKYNSENLSLDINSKLGNSGSFQIGNIYPDETKIIAFNLKSKKIKKDELINLKLNSNIENLKESYASSDFEINLVKADYKLAFDDKIFLNSELGVESKGEFLVSNIGDGICDGLYIETDDERIEIIDDKVRTLAASDKTFFKFKIDKSINKEYGEKNLRFWLRTKDNKVKKEICILNHTNIDSYGDFKLKILNKLEDSKNREARKVELINVEDKEHKLIIDLDTREKKILNQEGKEISDISRLKSFEDVKLESLENKNEIYLSNLLSGLYLYSIKDKSEKIIKNGRAVIKTDRKTSIESIIRESDLEIAEDLFKADFKAISKVAEYSIEHNLIIEGDSTKANDSLIIRGYSTQIAKGDKIDKNISIENTSNETVIVSTLVNEIKKSSGISIFLDMPKSIEIKPKSTFFIPVRIVSSGIAKEGESSSEYYKFKYYFNDAERTCTEGVRAYIGSKSAGYITKGGGKILYTSYGGSKKKDKVSEKKLERVRTHDTSLVFTTKITGNAKLGLCSLDLKNLKAKILRVDILDKDENKNKKLSKKNYKIKVNEDKSRNYKWVLSNNELNDTSFDIFARIEYIDESGRTRTFDTNSVKLELERNKKVDINYSFPKSMYMGKVYDFITKIRSEGSLDDIDTNHNLMIVGSNLKKVSEKKIDIKNTRTYIIRLVSAQNDFIFDSVSRSKLTKTDLQSVDPDIPDDLDIDLNLNAKVELKDELSGNSVFLKNNEIKEDKEKLEKLKKYVRDRKNRFWNTPLNLIKDPIDISTGAQLIKKKYFDNEGENLYFELNYSSLLNNFTSVGNFTKNNDLRIYIGKETEVSSLYLYIDELRGVKYSEVKNSETLGLNDEISKLDLKKIYRTENSEFKDKILIKTKTNYILITKSKKYFLSLKGELEYIEDYKKNLIKVTNKKDDNGLISRTLVDSKTNYYIRESYENNLLKRVETSTGRYLDFEYKNLNLVKITNELGEKEEFIYDEYNRIIKEKDALGRLLFKNKFDEMGRVIEQVDETGGISKIEYGDLEEAILNNKAIKNVLTDTLNNKIEYIYDIKTLKLLEKRDSKGLILKRTLDEKGMLVKEKKKGREVKITYAPNSKVSRITDGLGLIDFTYDKELRIKQVKNILSNTKKYSYSGNKIEEVNQFGEKTVLSKNELNVFDKIRSDFTQYDFEFDVKTGKIVKTKNRFTEENYIYDENARVKEIKFENGLSKKIKYNKSGKIISVENEEGESTKYSYNKVGDIIKITDALGNSEMFSYDIYKNLVSYTDKRGNETRFIYDTESNLIKVSYPDASEINLKRDQRGNLVEKKDENGSIEKYSYDENDKLISKTDALGNTEKYEYNKFNKIVKTIYKDKSEENIKYDKYGRIKEKIMKSGLKISYKYDEFGRLIEEKKGNKFKKYEYLKSNLVKIKTNTKNSEIEYDENFKEKIKSLRDELSELEKKYDSKGNEIETYSKGKKELKTYDALNRLKTLEINGQKYHYSYDKLSRIKKIEKENKNKKKKTLKLEMEYDENGNIRKIKDKAGNHHSFFYDKRNNLVKTVLENSENDSKRVKRVNEFILDNSGKIISHKKPNGNTIKFKRDSIGNIIEISDDISLIERNIYDSLGRKIQREDSLGNKTKFSYDKAGNLVSKENAFGGIYKYSYDIYGNLISVEEPLSNISKYYYDENDNLLKISKKENKDSEEKILRKNVYDKLGRRISKYYAGREDKLEYIGNKISKLETGLNDINYSYDDRLRLISKKSKDIEILYEYGNSEKASKITNLSESVERKYDENDNLLEEKNSFRNYKVNYSYNSLSNLLSIKLDDKIVKYEYDDFGNLIEVIGFGGDKTSYIYDKRNRIIKEKRSNGLVIEKNYNTENKLVEINTFDSSGVLFSSELLKYDKLGRIVKRENKKLDSKIKEISLPMLRGSEQLSQEYIYKDDKLSEMNNMAVNHDKNSNLINYETDFSKYRYYYDFEDRLEAISRFSYTKSIEYEPTGNKIASVEMGMGIGQSLRYVNDNSGVLSKIIKIENETFEKNEKSYLSYGDGLISELRNSKVFNYHYDSQGNTKFISDENGKIVSYFTYSPYGINEVYGKDSMFTYSGKYGIEEEVNGLYYMRDRYYNPELQRFLSPDKYEGDIREPISLNKYIYVSNDPVNFIDPSGLVIESIPTTWIINGTSIALNVAKYSALVAGTASTLGMSTPALIMMITYDINSFISDTADITSMLIGREDLVGEYDFLNKGFRKVARGFSTFLSDDENVHEQVEWLADGIYKIVEIRYNTKKAFSKSPINIRFKNKDLQKAYKKSEKFIDNYDIFEGSFKFIDHLRAKWYVL